MAKTISWKRTTEEGTEVQVYVDHAGNRWIFYHREKRFDEWQENENPPLEDWLELLDAVRRRIARRLLRPEEEARLKEALREQFPEADLP